MMRVCHLDTCPVGVATQNPVLRERFTGKPEFVVTFFEYIAEEVRELLAELGFRTLDEAIGHADVLDVAPGGRPLEGRRSRPLADPPRARAAEDAVAATSAPRAGPRPGQGARQRADPSSPRRALERGEPVRAQVAIRNVNRTVGTMLGHEVTKRYARRRAARRHDRPHLHRVGRPVVRRVPAARHHAAARGRRQRLRRQGAVRRPDRGPPRPGGHLRRRTSRSSPAT